jgi:hypothetical protein
VKDPVDFYYESLRGPYERLRTWADWTPGFGLLALILAMIPALVLILVCVFPWAALFIVARFDPNYSLRWDTVIFLLPIWVPLATLSIVIFWLIDKGVNEGWRREPPAKLSPDQLTFVEAYAAHQHLEMFLAASQADSLRKAQDHGRRLFNTEGVAMFSMENDSFQPDVIRNLAYINSSAGKGRILEVDAATQCGWWRHVRLFLIALQLESEDRWFQLAVEDRERMTGLLAVGPKVRASLEAEANLVETSRVLGFFVRYAYRTLFPEQLDSPSFVSTLDALVQAVSVLPEAPVNESSAPLAQIQEPALRRLAQRPAVRMVGWMAALSAAGAIALRITLNLSSDTIAVSVLPTAAVIAVWLAGFGPHQRDPETPPDSAH